MTQGFTRTLQTFGQWLKEKRESRGLTLRDVERITDGKLSNATISQLETGKIENPSILASDHAARRPFRSGI